MARIVMKFGGTSVGDVPRIQNVARRVKAEVERGHESFERKLRYLFWLN